ncbi:MAG: MFS transporter [Polyangiaceae bacterium]|jgi:MFS transporter, MHS family, shikimate and dehydroshikimate transport protein
MLDVAPLVNGEPHEALLESSPPRPTSITHVAIASFVGTAIEWYDFFLYGTAAALVFNKLFFPRFDPLVGTILAFATFAVGFVARPIGGVVFGHYGDRIGRKAMLSITLLIMGVATFAIGLLPTYAQIGIGAPILLVTLRLAQGFGLGGEWGGAVLMAIEHAPAGRRGFYGSWPQTGAPAGLLLSTGVFALVSRLPEASFLSWGWRVPFLVSIVLVGVGTFIRVRLAESPAFARIKSEKTEARLPIAEVLKHHRKSVALSMGARLAENAFFYVYTTFILAYSTERIGVTKQTVLAGVLLAAALDLVAIPCFGHLSDRFGRRPVYMFGAVFSALFVIPFFLLVGTGRPELIALAIVVGVTIGHAAMYGPQASFFSELFGAKVRYSGASLGYQLASVLAGGLSPMIAAGLLHWAHGAWWAIAVYMVGLALVTLTSVFLALETGKRPLDEAA